MRRPTLLLPPAMLEERPVDGSRFDDLARLLAVRPSRRQLLRALVGGMAGGLGRGAAAAKPCVTGGGTCTTTGACCKGLTCVNGVCVAACTPNCTGKTCGPDVCGGSCGTCGSGQGCCEGVCTDLTTTSNCGDCGKACDAGFGCLNGKCTRKCIPATCQAGQCGTINDGCGSTLDCGACSTSQCLTCGPANTCVSICGGTMPACNGSGSCVCTAGSCPSGQTCHQGVCCIPATTCPSGQTCGAASDGCGGVLTCGTCPPAPVCQQVSCSNGICVTAPDFSQNGANCGSGGHICANGVCSCPSGTVDCSGTCQQCCTAAICPTATCSTATCVGGTCGLNPIPNCCTADSQCDGGNPCTVDTCNPSTNSCQHTAAPTGTSCASNQICCGGQCVGCAAGQTLDTTTCQCVTTTTTTTPPPCNSLTCANGCCDANGVCQPGTKDTVCGAGGGRLCLDCTTRGGICCNTTCVDPKTDPNCGTCGNNCSANGLTCCHSQCVNAQTDSNNCGLSCVDCAAENILVSGGNCSNSVCCNGQCCGCFGPMLDQPESCSNGVCVGS